MGLLGSEMGEQERSRERPLSTDQCHGDRASGLPKVQTDSSSLVVPLVSASSNSPSADILKPRETSGVEVMKSSDSMDLFTAFHSSIGSTVSFLPALKPPRVDEEFICGWGAAFINITVTFPINKTIFRQQLQGISVYQAVRQIYGEGLRCVYRGLLPPLLQKTTTVSIMFGSYQKFRVHLNSVFPELPQPVNHAVAATLAGTLEATLAPFERVQTLMQDHTYQQRFKNALHAGKELRHYGLREYYRGITPILLRNGPSNVFFFLGREFLNDHIPQIHKDSSRLAKDFICGACLGALISTFFFPLNVVKTRMQSQLGGPYHGLWRSFQDVWVQRDRKVKNLFRGYHLNYTRSFISWGIINASYEYLMRLFGRAKASNR